MSCYNRPFQQCQNFQTCEWCVDECLPAGQCRRNKKRAPGTRMYNRGGTTRTTNNNNSALQAKSEGLSKEIFPDMDDGTRQSCMSICGSPPTWCTGGSSYSGACDCSCCNVYNVEVYGGGYFGDNWYCECSPCWNNWAGCMTDCFSGQPTVIDIQTSSPVEPDKRRGGIVSRRNKR